MEQNKREQFIIRRIGGTTYKVRVVFNESGGETMEDKILRIVRNDMVTSDGTSIYSPSIREALNHITMEKGK